MTSRDCRALRARNDGDSLRARNDGDSLRARDDVVFLCGIVGAGQHFIAVSNFAYFVTQVTRGADQIHHPGVRSTQLILS